jgi:hypothetical protein
MRSLLCFAAAGIVALAASSHAQEAREKPAGAKITEATYMVKGMH